MKILHVITSLKIGGAESALFNLLHEFKYSNDTNEHIIIYFYDGPNVKKIENLGFAVFKIKGLFFKYDFWTYFSLKKLIKKINPDLIHSSLWSANFFSRIIGRKLNIPVVCDLHSNFLFDGKIRAFIERKTAYLADKYIAVSHSAKIGFTNGVIKKILNQKIQKDLIDKLVQINNGINFDFVLKKSQIANINKSFLGFNENDFIIGSVGRLCKIKSYDLLLKSFALLLSNINFKKNYSKNTLSNNFLKLCIIGDGEERQNLENLAKKLNIEKYVCFLGEKSDASVFYSIFDCFVLTSKSEGLSIALLEALCFGLPVITTTNFQNYHDVIIDGENGFLVQPNNTDQIAKSIENLFLNKSLRDKIKNKNRQLVKEKFNIASLKKYYESIFYELVNSKKI